jgi:nicotinamide mononucleotide transporter
MDPWELLAAVAGVCCVALTVRQNIGCWYFGVVTSTLYAWIFWVDRLYAGAGLQAVYFLLQFYGWYQWRHGGAERKALTVQHAPRRLLFRLIAVSSIGTLGLGWSLNGWTDQSLPYADSAVTAFSLIAQWMMAHKLFETWAFWLAVDVLAVGLYSVQGLYPTAVLYAVYFVLATIGHLEWKRSLTSH